MNPLEPRDSHSDHYYLNKALLNLLIRQPQNSPTSASPDSLVHLSLTCSHAKAKHKETHRVPHAVNKQLRDFNSKLPEALTLPLQAP